MSVNIYLVSDETNKMQNRRHPLFFQLLLALCMCILFCFVLCVRVRVRLRMNS